LSSIRDLLLTINCQSKAVLVAADTAALLSCPVIDHYKDCLNGVVSNLNRFVKTGKFTLNFGKTNSMTFYTNNQDLHCSKYRTW
jgi:hypothetical protein